MPKQWGTPGPRMMYPAVCTSPALGQCSVEAQLLFDRLIAQADDQGRLIGDPRVVAGLCMPLVVRATPQTVRRWIDELVKAELVLRYASPVGPLLQLLGWWDHQGGMRRAYPSRWVCPDGWVDRVYGLPNGAADGGRYAGSVPADSGQDAGTDTADRGEMPPSRARAPGGAEPSRAESSSEGVTNPQPPQAGARPSRANGTNPRAIEAKQLAAAREKGERRERRNLAYLDGRLTQAQLDEMNERDAELSEIPAERGAAYV